MKRNILTLLIALLALQQTVAQTYDNLWKQAEIIAQKDQPKSEIAVMKKSSPRLRRQMIMDSCWRLR